jgi:tubulin polyglutamylase complex subunit 2
MNTVRQIIDQITIRLIGFLESHKGVTDVELIERQGVSEDQIQQWDRENSPYSLPDDLKAFLQISDGLLLQWKVKLHNQVHPLGLMNLNRLREIRPIESEEFMLKRLGDESLESADVRAFNLDRMVKDGRLALVYRSSDSSPNVYFQDLSCQWFFIANTFTDYFRLMTIHLGLPHWHYAFTEVGLDNASQQWFRFLYPERLEIDITSRKKHTKKKKQRKEGKRPMLSPTRKRKRNSGFASHVKSEVKSRRKDDAARGKPPKGQKKQKSKKPDDLGD